MNPNQIRGVVSFNLTPSLVKWLDGLAKKNNRSRSAELNNLLSQLKVNFVQFTNLVNSNNIENNDSDKNIQNVTVEQGANLNISISDNVSNKR